jgi:aspartate-semialdehyde dehydrogenase
MSPDVPLLIPEVNAAHLDAVPVQQKNRGYGSGFIVTNPNCSTAGLVLVLKPLADAFGLEKMFVVTMQAVSGAGYPGVPSLDILGNVVPFISGEEEKMEEEPQKILGRWDGSRFVGAGLGISAHCNRVPVENGHLECLSVSLKKIATLREVCEALRNFAVSDELAALPTAVRNPVIVLEEENRPQPRREAHAAVAQLAPRSRRRSSPQRRTSRFPRLPHPFPRWGRWDRCLSCVFLKFWSCTKLSWAYENSRFYLVLAK